jgi:hypothetical protein
MQCLEEALREPLSPSEITEAAVRAVNAWNVARLHWVDLDPPDNEAIAHGIEVARRFGILLDTT